jgi:hypothetical protein
MMIGCLFAGRMSLIAIRIAMNRRRGTAYGCREGAWTALIVAPLAILLTALITRFVEQNIMIYTDHQGWYAYLRDQSQGYYRDDLLQKTAVLYIYGEMMTGRLYSPLIVVGVVIACAAAAAAYLKTWQPLTITASVVGAVWIVFMLLVFLAPLFNSEDGFGRVYVAMIMTAVIWAIPGLIIGSLVPLLRRLAEVPRWFWPSIALSIAALLAGLTIIRLNLDANVGALLWLIVPCLALLLWAWFASYRGVNADRDWLFLAVLCGTLTCCATGTLQQVTTLGVMSSMHLTNVGLSVDTSIGTRFVLPEVRLRMRQIEANPFLTWRRKIDEVEKLLSRVNSHLESPNALIESQGDANDIINASLSSLGIKETRTLERELQLQLRVFRQMQEWEGHAQLFELAVTSSVAFWVTIGLLGTWKWIDRVQPNH